MIDTAAPENIDILILCGGKGARLKAVVNDRPKPMADIGERPFLDILIDYVSSYGFKRFILCTGYKSDYIKRYYENSTMHEIVISEERNTLGTAGAVKNAEKHIESRNFLVMNGDSFCKLDLGQLLSFHLLKEGIATLSLVPIQEGRDYGVVLLAQDDTVESFIEKTNATDNAYINAGVYVFRKELLECIPADKETSLEKEVFPAILSEKVYGYVTDSSFIDIGTPERYRRAVAYLGL